MDVNSGYSLSNAVKFIGFVCKYIPRGKGVVARLFGRVFSPWLKNKYLITRYGAKLVIDAHNIDFYATMYRWNNSWEHWVFDTAYWLMPQNGVFYDIGGNVGYMTIEMLQRKPNIQAVCFEPIPNLAATIIQSLALNGFSNRASVYKYGLSDRHDAIGTLSVPAHQIHASLEKNDNVSNAPVIEIDLVSLDQLCEDKNLALPDLIKIDIEGHEYKALLGANRVLKESKPHVLFEVSNQNEFKDVVSVLSGLSEYRYFHAIGSYRPTQEIQINEIISNKTDVIAVNLKRSNLPADLISQL